MVIRGDRFVVDGARRTTQQGLESNARKPLKGSPPNVFPPRTNQIQKIHLTPGTRFLTLQGASEFTTLVRLTKQKRLHHRLRIF